MEDDNSSQMAVSRESLSTLPEEIILHIFSFLPPEDIMFGVRATCRLFYDLSWNPSLWKQVTVTRISPDSPAELEPANSSYSSQRFYRKVLQQQCIGSSSNGSDSEGNLCRWKKAVREVIRSVEERGDIWPSCSVTGAMHYPNLQRLTLVRENLPSVEVLIKHQRLRHLELCMNDSLDHDNRQNASGQLVIDLFENLRGLTNLQTLDLQFSCSQGRQNSSTMSDIQVSMKDYFLTGPKLRQIVLNCFVNDEIFKAILDNCLQLKDLELYHPELTPEAFCAAVSGKRQLLLSALRIDHCLTLNDSCLKALSTAFPNLKSLQLSVTWEMTNDGLKLLFLGACSQLTDLQLTSNGHKMLGGKTSENVQYLRLFATTFHPALAFKNLWQFSQNLREIKMFSCNISNEDIKAMANTCRLLENVVVHECSGVDSTGVAYLMKNLPRLQKYVCKLLSPHLFQMQQLSPSRKRTRAGCLVLVNQPPTESRLWSLDLYYCQELTSVSVSALAVLYPSLRELQIRTTNCVNDHIVRVILRSLPNLQYLRLAGSGEIDRQNQLTGACLRHVQRWGTRLQRLELLTRYRFFSIPALLRLLTYSSTLAQCMVPHGTEHSPDISDSEMVRMITEQHDELQRQGKIITHGWFHKKLDVVVVDLLGLCVVQG